MYTQVQRPVDARAYAPHPTHTYPSQSTHAVPAQGYYAAQQPAPGAAYPYAVPSYVTPSYPSTNPTPASSASSHAYASYPAPAAAPPGVDPQRWMQGRWKYTGAAPAQGSKAAAPQDVGYTVPNTWGVQQHYYPSSNKVHKPQDPSYWATVISDNGLKLEGMVNPAKSSPFDGPVESGTSRKHKQPPPTPWVWEPALPDEDDNRQSSSSRSKEQERAQVLAQHREAFDAQNAARTSSSRPRGRESEVILPVEDPAQRRARENSARTSALTSASAQAVQNDTSRPRAGAATHSNGNTSNSHASRPNEQATSHAHASDMQRSHTLPAPVASRPGERGSNSSTNAEERALRTTFSPAIVRTPVHYRSIAESGNDTPRASVSSNLPASASRNVSRAQTMPDVVAQPSSQSSAQASAAPRRIGQASTMPAPGSSERDRTVARRHTLTSEAEPPRQERGARPKVGTALTKLQHIGGELGTLAELSPLIDSNMALFSAGSDSSGSSTVSTASTVRDEPVTPPSASLAAARRDSVDRADASNIHSTSHDVGGRRPSASREQPAVVREPSVSRGANQSREPSVQARSRQEPVRGPERQRQPGVGATYSRDQAREYERERESDQERGPYRADQARARESDRERERESDRERERQSDRDRERQSERDERSRTRESRRAERERRRDGSVQPTSPNDPNNYYGSSRAANGMERTMSQDSAHIPSPNSHSSTPNSSRYGTPASNRQRTPSSARVSNPPSLQPSPNRAEFGSTPFGTSQQQAQQQTTQTPPQAYHPSQSQAHVRSSSQQMPTPPSAQSHQRSASQAVVAQPQYYTASQQAQHHSSRTKTPSPQVYATTTPAKATPPSQQYSYPTPAATPGSTPAATQPASSASAQAQTSAAYPDPRYGHGATLDRRGRPVEQSNGYSSHSRSQSANVAPAATQPVSSASAAAAAHQSRYRQPSGEIAAVTMKHATPPSRAPVSGSTGHYHTSSSSTPQQAQRSNSGGHSASQSVSYSTPTNPTPYRPAAQAAPKPTSAAPRLRRGYWNRRGDHLTAEGYIIRAPSHRQYPAELSGYPDTDKHFRNHHGKEARDPRYADHPSGNVRYDDCIQYYN